MVQLSTDDVLMVWHRSRTRSLTIQTLRLFTENPSAPGELCEGVYPQALYHPKQLVFGKGNNFVNRVLEAADQGRALAVAEDQYGSPTKCQRSGKNYPAI